MNPKKLTTPATQGTAYYVCFVCALLCLAGTLVGANSGKESSDDQAMASGTPLRALLEALARKHKTHDLPSDTFLVERTQNIEAWVFWFEERQLLSVASNPAPEAVETPFTVIRRRFRIDDPEFYFDRTVGSSSTFQTTEGWAKAWLLENLRNGDLISITREAAASADDKATREGLDGKIRSLLTDLAKGRTHDLPRDTFLFGEPYTPLHWEVSDLEESKVLHAFWLEERQFIALAVSGERLKRFARRGRILSQWQLDDEDAYMDLSNGRNRGPRKGWVEDKLFEFARQGRLLSLEQLGIAAPGSLE
jgi:hypothetical protein